MNSDKMSQEQSLINASYCGDLAKVQKLVKQGGVDVNSVTEDNSPALACAAGSGHVQVVEWLLQNGADVNKKTRPSGLTPLFYACLRDGAWEK